jgi:hypothetical protein
MSVRDDGPSGVAYEYRQTVPWGGEIDDEMAFNPLHRTVNAARSGDGSGGCVVVDLARAQC